MINYGTQQIPGGVSYTSYTCPTCGAVLQIGTQAVNPAYTYPAVCPYCGHDFGVNAVAVNIVSGPSYPAYTPSQTTGFSMDSMMNMIMMIVMMTMMMSMVGELVAPKGLKSEVW